MAHKTEQRSTTSILAYFNRKDEALETWLQGRFPLVYRIIKWERNRMERITPVGIAVWFVVVLLLMISAYWL